MCRGRCGSVSGVSKRVRKLERFVRTVWILAAFAATAHAQVRGRVIDAVTSEALALAEVRETDAPAKAVKTGRDGRFEIMLSPGDGERRLRITLVGYRPLTVTAPPGGMELEIALPPDTLRQSESVDVKAGPFATEQDLAVALAGNELRNLASVLADDPMRAVQSLPGVASNDDFRAQFSIRGAGFAQVGVYLDGILMHAPFHTIQGDPTSASLSIIQGEMLESANVHTGPLPPMYADRTAGALDFRSRDGDAKRTRGRLTASASNAGGSGEGPIGKRATWLIAARKSYLQYIINRTSNDTSLDFSFWDVQGKVSVALTPRHQVSLTLIDGHSGLDRDTTRGRLGPNTVSNSGYHYTLAYAGWRYTREGLLVTQRLGWLDERYDNFNFQATRLQQGRYRELMWNGDASKSWTPRLETDAGWSVRKLEDNGFLQRANPYSGDGTRSGFYAQQVWNITPRLQVRAGGRRDDHSVTRRSIWLGNAGVALPGWRGARFHVAWSQTAQYPELLQFFSAGGNRALQPQRSAQAQVGLEQAIGGRSRLRVEFYNRQDRLLLFQPYLEARLLPAGNIFIPPAIPAWENSVHGYSRGGQVFFQRRAANGFTGWLSYGYNRARLRDARTGASFDSDFEVRHLIQAYASQRLRPTVNLSAKLIYGTGTPLPGYFRQPNPAVTELFLAAGRNLLRLPDYQRTDVRVNKLFARKHYQLTLFAEVINLTNRRNIRFDDLGGFDPNTGRARPQLDRAFPILPSAGIVIDF